MSPIEVDARGLRCPLPVIRLAEAARDAPAGSSVIVLATDPAARYDIAAWCRMRGHELAEMAEVGDTIEAPEPPREPGLPDSSSLGNLPADSHGPAYLRFVVRLTS